MVDKEIDFVTAKFQVCSKMEFDRFFTLVVYNQPIIAERFFFQFRTNCTGDGKFGKRMIRRKFAGGIEWLPILDFLLVFLSD